MGLVAFWGFFACLLMICFAWGCWEYIWFGLVDFDCLVWLLLDWYLFFIVCFWLLFRCIVLVFYCFNSVVNLVVWFFHCFELILYFVILLCVVLCLLFLCLLRPVSCLVLLYCFKVGVFVGVVCLRLLVLRLILLLLLLLCVLLWFGIASLLDRGCLVCLLLIVCDFCVF